MKFNIMLTCILVVLSIAMVFIWGCDQPTAPRVADQPTAPRVADQPTAPGVAVETQKDLSTGSLAKTASTNYYQCWTAGGGSVNCQNLSGGHYKVSWSNVKDIVVGKGYSGYSGTMSWSGGCSGCQYFGVYGWMRSPLTEFYVGRGGGTNCGSYSTSKGNYTLNTIQCNGANINGNGPFHQYNCSGSGSSGINLQQHYSGWSSRGKGASSPAYCIVATEAWNSSGSADVTVN